MLFVSFVVKLYVLEASFIPVFLGVGRCLWMSFLMMLEPQKAQKSQNELLHLILGRSKIHEHAMLQFGCLQIGQDLCGVILVQLFDCL